MNMPDAGSKSRSASPSAQPNATPNTTMATRSSPVPKSAPGTCGEPSIPRHVELPLTTDIEIVPGGCTIDPQEFFAD